MAGIIGYTTKLELDPGTATYAEVGECTMITLPTQDVGTIETTVIGQSDTNKTYTPLLTDSGVMTFECLYSKSRFTTLNSVRGRLKIGGPIPPTGNNINWRITLPDEDGGTASNQTFTFNGILTKLELSVEAEGLLKIKGEVKASGAITIA